MKYKLNEEIDTEEIGLANVTDILRSSIKSNGFCYELTSVDEGDKYLFREDEITQRL